MSKLLRRGFVIAACAAGMAAALPASASADVACQGDLAPVTDINQTDVEAALLCLTNAYRVQNGLAALPLDSNLADAARLHSDDMNTRMYFDHISPPPPPGGTDPSQRAMAEGYPGGAGENIAYNGSSPLQSPDGTAWSLFDQWRRSPGHNMNMLTASYNGAGFGVDEGCYCPPVGPLPGIMGTQMFGSSGADSTPPDTKLALQFGPIPAITDPAPKPVPAITATLAPAASAPAAAKKKCRKGRKLKRGRCIKKKLKKKK